MELACILRALDNVGNIDFDTGVKAHKNSLDEECYSSKRAGIIQNNALVVSRNDLYDTSGFKGVFFLAHSDSLQCKQHILDFKAFPSTFIPPVFYYATRYFIMQC